MLAALLFGALGGHALTRVNAAPQGNFQAACYGGPIAQWTFDNTISPSAGTGVFAIGSSASYTYISSGMNTPPALNTSGWSVAGSSDEYLEFSISTLGRTGIGLTFNSNRSSAGPDQYELRYSIDGSPPTTYDVRTITTDELLYIYDFSSDSSFDNKNSIVFRLYGYGDSGNWRIDNVTFTGTCTVLDNTPTSTSTPTASPIGSIIINEVAWMGTLASTSHEWLELYNPTAGTVNISNWKIAAADGSPSITIPSGTTIASGEYILLSNGNAFSSDVTSTTTVIPYSGASLLSDTGETLFLRDASNSFIDASNGNGGVWPAGTLTTASNHGTMERMGTGADTDVNWVTSTDADNDWNKNDIAGNLIHGTPGYDNWGYTVTNTPTSVPTNTPIPTNTFTLTPTITRTITPTAIDSKTVVITEVAWMGTLASSNDEWIELFNATNKSVNLTGWHLRSFRAGSGNTVYMDITFTSTSCQGASNNFIPCVIPPGGFFLMERGRDDVVSDIPADMIYPAITSTLLSNSGEMLLLCSTYNISSGTCKASIPRLPSTVVDIANIDSVGKGTPTSSNPWSAGSSSSYGSMERKNLLSNEDTNWYTHTGGDPHWGEDANGREIKGTPKHPNWAFTVTATVRATITPTRTRTPAPQPGPVLVLNEFVPRPGHDWNSDGQVNTLDEFVEVINAGQVPLNLSQYKLDDYEQDANGVEIKNGFSLPSRTLQPGEIAVFYASDTGFFLSDAGDTVRLVKASNYTIVDSITYPAVSSLDVSYCRYTDGYGSWLNRCFPTPGRPNSLTGDSFPPDPGGAISQICLLPDNAPVEFMLAECEQSGLGIWNPKYWDTFPGEGDEFWLYELWYKWLEIFQ